MLQPVGVETPEYKGQQIKRTEGTGALEDEAQEKGRTESEQPPVRRSGASRGAPAGTRGGRRQKKDLKRQWLKVLSKSDQSLKITDPRSSTILSTRIVKKTTPGTS